jgi:FkbM family methyltransferase
VRICGGANAGAFMHVDLACEKYYWLGTHEEPAQTYIEWSVRPGEIVYDVGAHAGFFTLLFARLTGAEGRVYAFEPVDANWSRLCRNVAVNGLANVHPRRIAISDGAGYVPFAAGPTSLQGRIAGASEHGTNATPATTIDDLVRDGCAPPSFIKIDVEGAEAAVLRGAADTIATHRPRMLIEVHSDAAAAEIASILTPAYSFHDLTTGAPVNPPLTPGHYDARPGD